MICQFCEVEYPAGVVRCAECESELVEVLPPPSDELVMEPVGILHRHRELLQVLESFEASDIPYEIQCGTAFYMQEIQVFADRVQASQFEARVSVVSSRFEEARALIASAAQLAPSEPERRSEGVASAGSKHDGFERLRDVSPESIRPK